MADEDEKSGSIDLARPKEEALRLKILAEEKYSSGDLDSAVAYANRARDLHPSISGLPEMLTAFEILRAAASPVLDNTTEKQKPIPDYYRILQVQRFSHFNSIKKHYKKLALTLHPDKNPFDASEEAFKLVGEAARVLSDKIRRKEYDMRLRIAMQSEAMSAVAVEQGAEMAGETFWTACSACRLLHQFERKYLGSNLICPGCKKTFKAMEVEEGRDGEGNGGGVEKNEQTRVSARIQERVAKGGYVGSVEKFGLGAKKRNSSVGEVSERLGVKVARTGGDGAKLKRVEIVEKLGESHGDSDGVENCRFKKMEKLVNVDGVEEAMGSGDVEIVENERSKRGEAREDESMTLSQMQKMMKKKKKKKKKVVEGKMTTKEKEVNAEILKVSEMEAASKKDKEREQEKENVGEEESVEEIEKGREREKGVNLRGKSNRRRVPKVRNLDVVNATSKNYLHSEIEKDTSSEQGNLEVLLVEKEKEKETGVTRGKREKRRVSKYENSDILNIKSSKNHVDSDIERLIANEKGDLEIKPVEDSDFHDFDKDRRERSFRKGQVWAVYDDLEAMPRQYALIDEIVSVNPFEVKLILLQRQSNGDEESWLRKRFNVSCGIFQVTAKKTVRYLNLFSHLVNCERASRYLYRIYPKKGSVWAVYGCSSREAAESDQSIEDEIERCYDVVVSLSSYSDLYGLSVAYLEKVSGFRAVFKRRKIGPNAVACLKANDIKILSHQIPAKKLSGEESSGLPKDCWELDPASLPPQLLTVS
ncbi:hypothetical protein C2S51_029911 [Perilla frutescens var. frutescens]|nr:hypothetical protein C2S51_029911 [Perilla frutescens var. frutescens]